MKTCLRDAVLRGCGAAALLVVGIACTALTGCGGVWVEDWKEMAAIEPRAGDRLRMDGDRGTGVVVEAGVDESLYSD